MILPRFASTAPTSGFGEVAPEPRRASRRARRMNWVSAMSFLVAADVRRLNSLTKDERGFLTQRRVSKTPFVAKNDEERLDSFLNLLFGIDLGAMLFFLIVRGAKLGEAQLPFQLAFFPFKSQVLMLAS